MTPREPWRGHVMTVEGLIPADEMRVTLPHEHLILQGWSHLSTNYFNSAYMELVQFSQAGGTTLCDLTTVGRIRDPSFLRRLGAVAGVQVIMGTGFYKDAWLPPEVHGMSVEEMTRIMVGEIVDGVGDTGIRAGVIGEIGVSRPITATEEKVLVASARAQLETGTAVNVHFDLGTDDREYHHALDILQEAGADLEHVAVSHLVPSPSTYELVEGLATRGCYVEFDMFGHTPQTSADGLLDLHLEVVVSSVRALIDLGLLSKILISQNVSHIRHMTANGGHGYAYLLRDLTPTFLSYGVSDQDLRIMMENNPRELLTLRC
ncbi:MAG: hypothetical protein DWP92_05290 [Armatimonadetes bacterium]|nr:MAG: hypothetical protein DWP92_05290 [Armatimonadota bacterium]